MIKITEVDKEAAMEFNEAEWDEVNDLHFGKGIRWNTTHFAFKAVEDGKTVGLIFGKHESGTIYVSNIIVAKDKRRQGIGTLLINRAEEFGREFKDHKIWLITGKDYPEDPFFAECGFKQETILPDLYFHKDFIVYVKEITY